jgi:hypothetical protein
MSDNAPELPRPSPFDDPEHSEVLASRDIIERGARITVVVHHENGRWGFYSESAARDFRAAVPVIFDQLIEEDPDISRMGFLKKGKMAIRMGSGMHERWIYPGEEKAEKSRGGCLGLLLFSVLGAAILLGVWRLSALLS